MHLPPKIWLPLFVFRIKVSIHAGRFVGVIVVLLIIYLLIYLIIYFIFLSFFCPEANEMWCTAYNHVYMRHMCKGIFRFEPVIQQLLANIFFSHFPLNFTYSQESLL